MGHTSHGLPTTQTTLWPFVQLSVGSDDMSFKALPDLVVLAIFLVRGCLSCGAKPIVTGNSFCATQQCTHIYNFRPCSYWNPAQCTCSGSTADSDGTKCYILRSGQSSWADASAQCRSNGDDRLAVITSANQNTAVQGLIGSTNAYIGLSDTAAEATFLWTDGSTTSSYSNWISGQPTTQDNQDCVVMRSNSGSLGQWAHVGCSKTDINFVCERKPTC